MRGFPTAQRYVVSLLEGFNLVGHVVEPKAWDESESNAVRLGQRGKVDPTARRRGLKVLGIMRNLAESGLANLIYTDDQRRRVPYSQSSGYWLTAIHPDPLGTGEGFIELDDRYVHPCVVDIRQFNIKRSLGDAPRSGRKRGFLDFDTALKEYFRNNPVGKLNADVIYELGRSHANLRWPGKTVTHERINDARSRAETHVSVNANNERTPDGD